MKILHLVFHPNLKTSRVNRIWKEQLENSGKITTSRDVYKEYPDFKINVAQEQELLLQHDRIIIQFPLYCKNNHHKQSPDGSRENQQDETKDEMTMMMAAI